MANEKNNKVQQANKQQRAAQAERRRRYEDEKQSAFLIFLIVFAATAVLALVGLIVTLATDAVYVHNTSMTEDGGREVAVGGAAFLKALFTGNFSSADAGYDDIAVPFYYYAKDWCQPVAILTLLTVVFSALTLALSAVAAVFAIWKKEYLFTCFTLLSSLFMTVFAIAAFAMALGMSGSQILPVYCQGNPACSIQSDAIGTVIVSVLALGGNLFAFFKFMLLEKQRKAIRG